MGVIDLVTRKHSKSPKSSPVAMQKDIERQDRLLAYQRTWDAYLAELPNPIVHDPKDLGVDDNIRVNPARALVNTSVYFLFGNSPTFELSPEAVNIFGTGGTTPVEQPVADGITEKENPDWLKALNRAWKANRKDSLLYNLGLSGAIHGTVFIKIVPNSAGMRNEYPRLVVLDPANVDVELDPNDCDRVLKYIIEYRAEDETGKPYLNIQEITADVNPYDVIESWEIQNYRHDMEWYHGFGWLPGQGLRVPVGDPISWAYSWAPIEHCQNIEVPHRFWGLPDLDTASVDVICSLQRAMSSLNKIVRIHASPRMYAKNVIPDQVEDIDVSADNIITLPNMDADLQVLQTLQNISPSIEFTDKLREQLCEMLQIPAIALGRMESPGTSISGVNMSIQYAPIIQKTELKRISYGDMLVRLNHKLLELLGYPDYEDHEGLVIVWPENLPGSAYLNRQTLSSDIALGVSKYTAMEALGYDPVEEEQRRMHETEQQLRLESEFSTSSSVEPSTEEGEETRGGANNPSGYGNKNGSMGGVNSANVAKNSKGTSDAGAS